MDQTLDGVEEIVEGVDSEENVGEKEKTGFCLHIDCCETGTCTHNAGEDSVSKTIMVESIIGA